MFSYFKLVSKPRSTKRTAKIKRGNYHLRYKYKKTPLRGVQSAATNAASCHPA